MGKLQRFNPTKIAVEGQYSEDYWTSRYREYVAGNYQLGRNEIEQIAFRLAKRLSHAAIYPVDYEMWMDGRVPAETADPVVKPKPAQPANAGAAEPPPEWIKQREELFKKSTVLEYLRFLNSDEARRPDHASYMDMLLPDDRRSHETRRRPLRLRGQAGSQRAEDKKESSVGRNLEIEIKCAVNHACAADDRGQLKSASPTLIPMA